MQEFILNRIYMIPAILVGFAFHEFAHALVADRLGDKTPRFQGRLTLNPMAHIDLIGFVMTIIAGFGWAKPVQVNPSAFKNYRKDDFKVSIAGPLANIITAFIFTVIMVLYARYVYTPMIDNQLVGIIFYMLYYISYINIALFLFNLIPIPGLDGFRILADLFPRAFDKIGEALYQYQIFIMLIFLATPITRYIISKPASIIYSLFINILSVI
ncbi:site-2 protease family protein [Clostridium sp. 19966]|uniref:site-2 protease family protein n=1 Tax=Clostridium sp. 19966 TaxID=2768166 RepID=UPI0028E0201A|nr:site-2 protease family protein [Clostridium sp. 19966]MDT8719120.1 site-2 protease family protein [Clostridium sp. 19966]